MNTCKDCKWWGSDFKGCCGQPMAEAKRSPRTYYDSASFECSEVGSMALYADADDDSGLECELVTGPDFGCIKFSQKTL